MPTQEVLIRFKGDPAQLQAAIKQMTAAYNKGMADITREAKQEARSAEALQRQRSAALIRIWNAEQREHVRLARQAEREIQRAAEESLRNRRAMLAGATAGFTALLGISAISEIRAAGAAILNYASNLETTTIAFTTMMGSADLAKAHLQELQQFALKTPFQFQELISASQRMQALGFNAEQVVPILTDVGNAVAAAGGGSERLDRVVLALSQIQSKGKVATQEMNQLAESGISGWKILEAQLGKSRAELIKMVEAGQISSAVFLEAFQKFSQQNFGGLMEQQSKTFSGAMSNIKDALLQTSAVAFAPLYQRLSELAQGFGESATKSKEFREEMIKLGSIVTTTFDGLVMVVLAVKDAIALVFAAVTQQFAITTHLAFALASAIRAVVYVFEALIRVIRGDFVGAGQMMDRSFQQSKRAAEELGEAVYASGTVVREFGRIWQDTATRSLEAAMKMVQAGMMVNAFAANMVGADVGTSAIGAGIFRPKGTNVPTTPSRTGKSTAETDEEKELKQRERDYTQLQEAIRLYRAQLQGVSTDTRAYAVQQSILNGALRSASEEVQNQHRAAAKSADNFKIQLRLQGELHAFLKQQQADVVALTAVDKGHIDITEDFIAALEKQGAVLAERTKTTMRASAVTLQLAADYRIMIAALEDLSNMPPPPTLAGEAEGGINAAGAAANAAAGVPPVPPEVIDSWLILKQTSMDALHSMAGGIGNLLQQWIIYGTVGPNAVRKMLAAILSQASAQAAVEAIMQLAYAWKEAALASASAAVFDVRGAALHSAASAAHLTSAAVFGGVAAVAAASGRLIAGNAFNESTKGASSTSSGSGGSSSPKPQEVDRRGSSSFQSTGVKDVLEVRFIGELGELVETKWIERYNGGGRLRNTVQGDGQN